MASGVVFAFSVHLNFEIGLPFLLRICISWLSNKTQNLHYYVLKLRRWFICRRFVAIAMVVHFDHAGLFQQVGTSGFKL
jgi:hypothetical protein